MKRILIFAMFGLTAVAPIAVAQIAAAPAAAQSVAADQTVIFAVENMTCALCPVTVKSAMEGVEGVRSVEINFEARTATVVFDAAATDANAIGAASTNAGYPAAVGG
jgi:mercuric ion binding protein